MLVIAAGIILAMIFIACVPLLLRLIEPVVVVILTITVAPFLFLGWLRSKLFGRK